VNTYVNRRPYITQYVSLLQTTFIYIYIYIYIYYRLIKMFTNHTNTVYLFVLLYMESPAAYTEFP